MEEDIRRNRNLQKADWEKQKLLAVEMRDTTNVIGSPLYKPIPRVLAYAKSQFIYSVLLL